MPMPRLRRRPDQLLPIGSILILREWRIHSTFAIACCFPSRIGFSAESNSELTEAQNIALEELRLEDGNWEPAASTLSDRLVDVVGELLSESYTCGWRAAAELTETELVPGGPGPGDPADPAGWFAEALTGAVVEALVESHRDGRGPRQAAASLSRVYRSWRTDEAERRVRDMASRSYHRGLIDGFGAAGLAEARPAGGRTRLYGLPAGRRSGSRRPRGGFRGLGHGAARPQRLRLHAPAGLNCC